MNKEVSKILLDIKAVFLRPNEPFTWASGTKSPIYCDNRLILSYPKERKIVIKALAKVIQENYPTCEVIMGTSTAGISHAALVSEVLDLPMGYVRSSAKGHGRTNQIEGVVPVNKNVVVIEDTISTAGSAIEVVNILRESGCNVLGIASIFTYNLEKGLTNLANANVVNHSITNFETLAVVANDGSYINNEELEKVKRFQKNPDNWL